MSDAESFQALIQRVRAGDQAAAAELVRRYEPAVRRAVRFQIRDNRLRRQLDSMDVCQSVLGSFFVRAASGQYELDRPENLLNLLVRMARNKLATQARKGQVVRRDLRDVTADNDDAALPARDASPSEEVAGRDLLAEVRRRLSEEERALAEQRAQGREWADIAAAQGGSQEALRKKLARALDRVADELGLDELCHE
jgi:RNA polymerase sigma-70 factor (ECF subfamily)